MAETMQAKVEELAQILVFADVEPPELERLKNYMQVQRYCQGEIVNA